MTKDELLLKGFSPEEAEIVSQALDAQANKEPENPLLALKKELDLSKAKVPEGDDEPDKEGKDDDYNPEYMKKNMRRYMKENKKACAKMMKEMGDYSQDMKKALEDFDEDGDYLLETKNLAPFMETFTGITPVLEGMVKAIVNINEELTMVKGQNEKTFDLMQKAASVTADQAEIFQNLNQAMSKSNGRKGITGTQAPLQKAATPQGTITPEVNKQIFTTLMKAVKNGVPGSDNVISILETVGKDVNKLPAQSRQELVNVIEQMEAK